MTPQQHALCRCPIDSAITWLWSTTAILLRSLQLPRMKWLSLAVANTFDTNGDGRQDRYGLVWNFVEPFFAIPFLTGYGAWVFDDSGKPVPALDTPESVSAYEFILSLQQEHGVVPRNCDYETADSLFKSGKAAMIINGDWSWSDYLETEGIDAVVAPLPVVSATGKPMAPMVSPKGYSLNALVSPQAAEDAMQFVQFMTSSESQRKFMELVRILPSRKKLLDDPLIQEDLDAGSFQRAV